MQGFAYLRDVVTLALDESACDGCEMCVEVCPHQVFAMREGLSVIVRRDACIECGACQLNCEAGALTVNAGVGCAAGIISEWWQQVRGQPAKSGGCC